MVARGFTGDVRTLAPSRLHRVDVLWGIASVVTAIVVVGGDRALGH